MAGATFEWKEDKNRANQLKHGVSFELAQEAFLDPRRVIVPDLSHSGSEERFFLFGKAEDGVMTVRFTWRNECIRIIGAGTGVKAGRSMKKKMVRYTEGEIGKIGPVLKDFLPPPHQLVLRDRT